jgi:hypothetical protein
MRVGEEEGGKKNVGIGIGNPGIDGKRSIYECIY